ncbi:MAG TPA: hypothetical protein VII49_02280 [Rhizomicrobium sp.]
MSEFRGRALCASLFALSCVLLSTTAFADTPKPGWGKTHHTGSWDAAYRAPGAGVTSGTWAALTNSFPGSSPETALLMPNGTVIAHDACTSQWYRLTPDSSGNYNDGKWTTIAAMPSGYTPLYYASQVLPSGDVIMNGGEYNTGCQDDHTTLGAWYNAKADKWTSVAAPTGWNTIGDAVSIVLQSGTYMLSNCCDESDALATITRKGAVTWTTTGSGKGDDNNEEGWTLLPTGNVLAVDVWATKGKDSAAELYSPSTGDWSATGTATNIMADPNSFELGPALLLPNNTVFQIGTDPCAGSSCASHTSIYNVSAGTWTAGPDELKVSGAYYTTEDAPAVVLPDGNVLSQQSPGYSCGSAFCSPSHFFEYDGTSWTQVSDPAQAPSDAAYEGRLLPLPTGQVLWTSDQGDVEIYTPVGSPKKAWLPTITNVPSTLSAGEKTTLSGTQLMGVADGGKYGDDAQMQENYPIIRISNNGSGTVCFATTSNWSPTKTKFNMPKTGCQSGASELEVVVNGIASKPAAVTVQ